MAFTNIFRRHSVSNEVQAANYACMDENSIAETLLDELETQCRSNSISSSSKAKRNSQVAETSNGLLAATYPSNSKRHASVDYSWLSPQNNLLQTTNDLYHLPDMIKMELSELIHNVSPEDCTHVVNQFRREIRSQQIKATTPESIIALFRKTLADYVDQKQKNRSNSNETHEGNKTICSLIRNNRVLPKYQSEDEQHSIAELAQISLSSPSNEETNVKPRANTCI